MHPSQWLAVTNTGFVIRMAGVEEKQAEERLPRASAGLVQMIGKPG
jgi:hypothetical protein